MKEASIKTEGLINKYFRNYGKYRGILWSAALFLLLYASLMLLNLYISFQITEDAIGINLAGHQRMLSQRMAKSLYALSSESPDSENFRAAVTELKNSTNQFDESMIAFTRGGKAHSADQELVTLNAVHSDEGQALLKEATKIWMPYKFRVEKLLLDLESGMELKVGSLQETKMDQGNHLPEALLQAKKTTSFC